MLGPSIESRLVDVLGSGPVSAVPLGGGCIADVRRVVLEDGRSVVIKQASGSAPSFEIEAGMLADLAATQTVRVPGVFFADPGLLVLEWIENDGVRTDAGLAGFADSLAGLHGVAADRFGYERDTLIGPLFQANKWRASWAGFYAESRVMEMARIARTRGGISGDDEERLGRLCAHMPELLGDGPSRPALIHGDLWSGNVLWDGGGVAALIDPAVYYADPEVELAFMDLFGDFGPVFWDRYTEIAGIRPGFWERRKDVYSIYPLLVHAALFGGGYGSAAMGLVRGLGF